jgi:hypothetical protein
VVGVDIGIELKKKKMNIYNILFFLSLIFVSSKNKLWSIENYM